MLMPTSTLAIVGIGNASTSAKPIVPKNNFFIFQPLMHFITICLPSSFRAPHQQQHDTAHKGNGPHNGRQGNLNIPHPRRVENGVQNDFIGLSEQVHRPSKHLKMIRFDVVHQVPPLIPFLKKKEAIFIFDILAEVAALASPLQPDRTGK